MRIIITDSVPLNGGDEALLRATVEAISARWPEAAIKVLCRDVDEARLRVPDLDLEADLDHAFGPLVQTLRHRARSTRTTASSEGGSSARASRPRPGLRLARETFRTLRRHSDVARLVRGRNPGSLRRHVSRMLEPPARRAIVRLYEEADVIISAPGGFFSDHYDIEGRLRAIELAVALGKPVVLIGQSIGPFWKPDSLRRVPEAFNLVSRICVRDRRSAEVLHGIGVESSRVMETADMAFLWKKLAPEHHTPSHGEPRSIGLCFRVWPLDDGTLTPQTLDKAERLCRKLLNDPNRLLYFVSTCQGIPGYIDDSELAVQLVARLPEDLAARCKVDRQRYDTLSLMKVLGQLDLFIGMRLHGCLLSMLGGTPAMGLGYEHKTKAIFTQLGFERYQTPFESEWDDWEACTNRTLEDLDTLRNQLSPSLDRLCLAAEKNIEALVEHIERPRNA